MYAWEEGEREREGEWPAERREEKRWGVAVRSLGVAPGQYTLCTEESRESGAGLTMRPPPSVSRERNKAAEGTAQVAVASFCAMRLPTVRSRSHAAGRT